MNDTLHVTTDPNAIRQALSQPNTVYAVVEEESAISNNPIEDAVAELVETSNPQSSIPTPSSPIPAPSSPTSYEFTEDDWNAVLEDVGFHPNESSTQPIQVAPVPVATTHSPVLSTSPTATESIEGVGEDDNDEESNEEDESSEESTENVTDISTNLIAPNSPSILIDDSTSRFSGTEWYNEIQKSNIIIAGLGGIGSNLAFQIARMHPASLFLYDDDNVEIGNMSGQLFSREDVERNKANAIASMITSYTSMTNPFAINTKFTSTSEAGDIMMCGFDSMKARNIFFNSWKKHVIDKGDDVKRKKCLFLDGRLSIDTLQVFAITGDDHYNIDRYENEYLFDDYEADETICSLKQTTYLACMIASVMTNLFTNFTANLLNPDIPYDLPFFTEYDAQNMLFKTEN